MSSPSQQLVELLRAALVSEGVGNEKEIGALMTQVLAGKVKAEDWYLAVENSIQTAQSMACDGK